MKKVIIIMAIIVLTPLQTTNLAKAELTGVFEYDSLEMWRWLFGWNKKKQVPKQEPKPEPKPKPKPKPKPEPKPIPTEVLILEILKKQLALSEKVHNSITGNRQFSYVKKDESDLFFKNPQYIYNQSKRKELADQISALFAQIIQEEQNLHYPSIREARKSINIRSRYAAIIDKAISLRTFQEADNRFEQISELVAQIDKTVDPKSIAELQARIKGMLTMIQNETAKLQMIAHSRNAEQALINQLKREHNTKILGSANKEMPIIRSIR